MSERRSASMHTGQEYRFSKSAPGSEWQAQDFPSSPTFSQMPSSPPLRQPQHGLGSSQSQDTLFRRVVKLHLDEARQVHEAPEERVVVLVLDHELLGVVDPVEHLLVEV